ncbi:hypothetical protein BH09DEP1_BH09DEP1_0400 [soil metagenome]
MKTFIYFIFVSSFICAMDRQALRALYKDDQHKWLVQPPAQPDTTCGICLQPDQKCKSLPCHKTHTFCSPCISQWLSVKNTCPICRAEIIDSLCCTCLKSLSKPGVFLPSCFGLVYTLIKAGERAGEYVHQLQSVSPDCGQHCAGCSSMGIYCGACLALGPMIYCLKKYKYD